MFLFILLCLRATCLLLIALYPQTCKLFSPTPSGMDSLLSVPNKASPPQQDCRATLWPTYTSGQNPGISASQQKDWVLLLQECFVFPLYKWALVGLGVPPGLHSLTLPAWHFYPSSDLGQGVIGTPAHLTCHIWSRVSIVWVGVG